MFVNKFVNNIFLLPKSQVYYRFLSQCRPRRNRLTTKNTDFKGAIYFSFQSRDNRLTQKNWGTSAIGQISFGSISRQFATMSDSDGKKAELKEKLTPLQYHITQEKGTER